MQRFFWCLLLYTLLGRPAHTQPVILSNDKLEQQVTVAMEKAKHNDVGTIIDLARNKEQVVPYLEKYVSDPDSQIRYAVIEAAVAIHTAKSVKLISPLVNDKDNGREAISALYLNFDPTLIGQGGETLKQSLLTYLKDNGFSSQAVLLLTCFPSDQEVLQSLKQTMQDMSESPFPVVVARAELNEPGALEGCRDWIKHGGVDTLTFLLDAHVLKFVNNPVILSDLVPLVKDKRDSKETLILYRDFGRFPIIPKGQTPKAYLKKHPPGPDTPPQITRFRICDVALPVLAYKTGVDVGLPGVVATVKKGYVPFPRRYTDAELEIAYQRLTAYFKAKLPPVDTPSPPAAAPGAG